MIKLNIKAVRFASNHADFVNDIKYDYYGKRLATCSSDQSIRIWDLDDKGEWIIKNGCEWKNAHQSIIWRLAWAHPEFGQVIATCSADRTVKVWEEQEGVRLYKEDSSTATKTTWYPKVQLSDSKKAVQDIDFAPRHLGLKLATASADGNVRIYEAIDVMNLTYWPLQEVFEVGESVGVTCLSWNKSSFDDPMIAVGTESGHAQIWRFDESLRAWLKVAELSGHQESVNDISWAPNMGRRYHLIATCGKDRYLKVHRIARLKGSVDVAQRCQVIDKDMLGEVWRVEWNITGTVLAVGGEKNSVKLFKMDVKGDWINIADISPDFGKDG